MQGQYHYWAREDWETLSPLPQARALVPDMQPPSQAERGHFWVGHQWQWILLFHSYSQRNVLWWKTEPAEHWSCSLPALRRDSPPLLPMSSLHQAGSQDLAVWPSHLQISTSALVAATHVALQWTAKGWIVKDFISAHPLLCCPYFLSPPAHCARRLGLGGREGATEMRVAGRKAKVLKLTRCLWTRLGHVGLHERTSVFFSLLFLPLLCPAGLSTVVPFFHDKKEITMLPPLQKHVEATREKGSAKGKYLF